MAGSLAGVRTARAQAAARTVQTPVLDIAYEDSGAGFPIILLHGFPDDVRAWDDVAPPLVKAGYRVLVPYLRGYGPTRFRDTAAPRMAEQAAIGQDLVDFASALNLPRFAVAGYDWGGRAASIAAALHADRIRAAVLIGGYSIQNTVGAQQPAPPAAERAIWYQYYFQYRARRAGLAANRRSLCRLLWETWSPGWHFSDETFNRTAVSFDNPEFRGRGDSFLPSPHRECAGEARFLSMEQELAQRPKIQVPTIVSTGPNDGIAAAVRGFVASRARLLHVPGGSARHRRRGTLSPSRKTGCGVVRHLELLGTAP